MAEAVTLAPTNISAVDQTSSAASLPAVGIKCQNISDIINAICCNKQTTVEENERAAFMYIVIVILFYALSIVILMVKYIRQEEDNARLEWYYDEFVKREHFRSGNPSLWHKRRDSRHHYFFSEPPSTRPLPMQIVRSLDPAGPSHEAATSVWYVCFYTIYSNW